MKLPVIVAAILLSLVASAAPFYRYEILPDIGDQISPFAINDNGWVTGIVEGPAFPGGAAFLYRPGLGIEVIVMNAWGNGINNAGVVVGTGHFPSSSVFYREPDGTLVLVDMTQSWTLNESGQIIGRVGNRALLYTPGVGTIDLGTLGGGWSEAGDINESGQIVGYSALIDGTNRAFLYTPGFGMINLGTFPGYPTSMAIEINDVGDVVGEVSDEFATVPTRAFLYTAAGGMRELGTLGGESSSVSAINNSGWVIGRSVDASGKPNGFLYRPGLGMADLSSLVVGLGDTLISPRDINARGQIVGTTLIDGEFRSVVLTPIEEIPEPGTPVMFLAGFRSFLYIRFRALARHHSQGRQS